MSQARPITHFAQVLTDEGDRFINLGTDRAGREPELAVQIYQNGAAHFAGRPVLSALDVQLVAQLAADYALAQQWLNGHTPNVWSTNTVWCDLSEQAKTILISDLSKLHELK